MVTDPLVCLCLFCLDSVRGVFNSLSFDVQYTQLSDTYKPLCTIGNDQLQGKRIDSSMYGIIIVTPDIRWLQLAIISKNRYRQ